MKKEQLIELRDFIQTLSEIRDIEDLMPKMSAYSYMYECNKDRLSSYAINYLGRLITFKEFFDKIDNTAKAYVELGVKQESVVSMCMLTTPEALISFYALNKIGALVHMINIANSKEEVTKHMINTSSEFFVTLDIFYDDEMKRAMDNVGAKKVIISSLTDSLPIGFSGDKVKFKFIEALKKKGNAVNTDYRCINWKYFQKIGKNSDLEIKDIFAPTKSTVIAYTSGSEGEAKAVVTTDEAMNAMPVQMGMTDETFQQDDVIFNTLPLWIYYSLVNNSHVPLCLGVTLAMDPLFDSKKVHNRLKQFKFNHWNTIPIYVEDFVKNKQVKKMDVSFIKSITTGGDFLFPQLQQRGTRRLNKNNSSAYVGQGYGASEILGSFAYTYEADFTSGSIGKPLIGNKFKILDLENSSNLLENEVGELYLYSPTLMKEYFNNLESTNESLVVDENGITWYRTGDLAHFNEKGELFIDGRIRRIVMAKDDKGLPTKIFPDKIKKIIMSHPLVEKCEIVTIADSKQIKVPVAFIVLKNGIELTSKIKEEIYNVCKEHLEKYTMPIDYIFVSNIPLKPSLKPDLEALENQYEELANGNIKKKSLLKK